jgi:GTPase SAR1 family protein
MTDVQDYVDYQQVPFVLVANKCDLDDFRVVSVEEGETTARQWDNCCFLEASAKLQISILYGL